MSRVLLLLFHPDNRRLLSDWLARDYDVMSPSADDGLKESLDLAVLDAASIASRGETLPAGVAGWGNLG